MSEDNYFQQAEYLVTKGYVAPNTNISDLAAKLMAAANVKPAADCMTRETVYRSEAPLIKKISDSKQPHEKTLITPGERESAALADANKNDDSSV